MVQAHDRNPFVPLPARGGAGVFAKLAGSLRGAFGALPGPRHMEEDPEVATYLAKSGGRFTDSMERELMERILSARH